MSQKGRMCLKLNKKDDGDKKSIVPIICVAMCVHVIYVLLMKSLYSSKTPANMTLAYWYVSYQMSTRGGMLT